ncbi:serine protease inhibitor ecotin [Tamlana sp. I1]|uniref:serine protease inhibitor ecotin n=1 Tax=Tamlana sp. I1 TaxID=2762061 RepID=UPI00188EA5B4|nr:serine protease inhibitor ecotin [Tamlana sp. I1]
MKFKLLILAIVLFVSCKSQNQATSTNKSSEVMATPIKHDISMYPKADDAQLRHIINIPKTQNDDAFKVELYVGKMAEVDCNKSSLSGSFREETVSGWGYSYLNFETNGQIISTRMLCPDNTKHEAFVNSASEMVRYNSKLPIVVYTPKGYEVRYKIWSRSDVEQTAKIQ